MLLRLLTLLCLLQVIPVTLAQSPVLELTHETSQIDLHPYLGILQEPASGLQVQDLPSVADQFQGGWQRDPQIGYSRSAWWGKFEVVNHANHQEQWYLLFHNDQTGRDIQAYVQPSGAAPSSITPLPPLANTRINTFHLTLPPSQQQTVWIRIRSSHIPLSFGVYLHSQAAMLATTNQDYLFYGTILGGLLALAAYNLLTFAKLRETSFLGLSFFILAIGMELCQLNGLTNLITSRPDDWEVLSSISPLVAIASGVSFFHHLMDLPKRLPQFVLPFRLLFWANLIMLPVSPFIPFAALIPSSLGSIVLGLASFVTFLLFRRGVSEARSFTWAFLVLLPCTIPVILVALRVIDYWPPTIDLLHFGLLGFAILLSLTQSERIRTLREQGQRAEAASQAKSKFLTTMNHELRTPMNAVISSGTLLQRTTLTPQQQDYVDRLETSSRHMLNLINDILDLSRIESTQMKLEQHSFTLAEILANLHALLDEQARHKGLKFTSRSWFPVTTPLLGDPTRLAQVLLNLLGNALKFTEQGQVDLFIRPCNLSSPNPITLRFEVVDTGIGLSQEHINHLFEPFFQVQSNTTRRYGGTGMGLAISHKLIELMDGKLEVASQHHKGSRFFFTLAFPLAVSSTDQPIRQKTTTSDDHMPGRLHILLVDDDEMNLFFGRELLQTLGTTVTTAGSGLDALQQLQQQPFDLVFMDVSMPEMDGYETTRRIRRHPRFAHLPILALTAHAIAGERERCLAAGMDDYLTKPLELARLRDMLKQWGSK